MPATAARADAKAGTKVPDPSLLLRRTAGAPPAAVARHPLSPSLAPADAVALLIEHSRGEGAADARRGILGQLQQTYGNRYAGMVVAQLRAIEGEKTGKPPTEPLEPERRSPPKAPVTSREVATLPPVAPAPVASAVSPISALPAAPVPTTMQAAMTAVPAAKAEAEPTHGKPEAAPAPVSPATPPSAAVAAPPSPPSLVAGAGAPVAPAAAVPATTARPSGAAVGRAAPAAPAAPGGEAAAPAAEMSPREAIAPAAAAVHHRAAHARAHSPPHVPVASAQEAAKVPSVEQKREAATATVAKLERTAQDQAAKPVPRDDFRSKLKKAIHDATTPKPTTESAANKMMKTGATQASTAMRGHLASERDAATGPLKAQAQGKPEADVPASPQPAAQQTSLQPEPIGAPPAPVSPASVVPTPLPAERLDYSSDHEPTDRAMAENNVTKEQLEKGNEPEFGQTLEARTAAEEHEASAQARYRESEAKLQDHAQQAAHAELARGLSGMHGTRLVRVSRVVGKQFGTAAKNAAERQRITETINGFKDKTRSDVADILSTMETEATSIFEAGLKRAERAYEATFKEEKGGAWTWLTTWGSDWEELIERSLGTARDEYLRQVDIAIDQVADLIEGKLAAAKRRVAQGRVQVYTFRDGLDHSVQHFADEAIESVTADFDGMVAEIDQRRDALVDKLAQQYKSSYERMSAMEERLREENKSLWQRIYDATVGLIKKILAFKDMLLEVLAKAASVIVDIISDPIGFLGNLVDGVMQGLKSFMSNIGDHLKKGLMQWLFGALAGAGLQLPDSFDLEGIVKIVLQVLGLTYATFRARAVAIVGEPVVAALEKAAEVFKIVATEGISGLWRFIKEKVNDLKSMVLDAIFDFIKERVIIAGVTWVIGLLNPVSAFFKACKAIYDIVMFFIKHGSEIIDLVNAVIDSIAAIAKGSISVAATMVENALAKAIPIAIEFLASLLGLGDIGGTVRSTIEKGQTLVYGAMDWVINQAVKLVKAVGKFVGGLGKKEAKPTDDPEHDAKVNAGLIAIREEEKELLHDGKISRKDAIRVANVVKTRHRVFKSIDVVDGGDRWNYRYVASEGLEEGPPKAVTIADMRFLIFTVPGVSVRIQLVPAGDEMVLAARANTAKKIQALMEGELQLDEPVARALVNKLPGSDLDTAYSLMLQFSRQALGGPKEWVIQQVRTGVGTTAAWGHPPEKRRRALGVNLGPEEPGGEQREVLSKYAHVFLPWHEIVTEPGKAGTWWVKDHPEAGGREYLFQGSTRPDVISLGAIEVDDDGNIVGILEVSRNLKGGAARLKDLMKAARWPVDKLP